MTHSEPWQVKKLYLHLYEQNPVKMDWRKPLGGVWRPNRVRSRQPGI